MRTSYFRKAILGLGLVSLFVSMPLASNQASVSESRYRYFVQTSSRAEVRRLAGWLSRNEFDVAGINLKKRTVEVLTDEKGVQLIQAKGHTGRLVVVPVIGGKNRRLSNLDSRYLDPDKVTARLEELHRKFPSTTRIVEIGRSLRNRPIFALVISTTPSFSDPSFHDKPTVLFDGMHHAREIMTPEIVLDIGESILVSVRRVARARATLENMNIVLVPMVNVDGNARVWSDDNMWRKNARSAGADVFGVDINRNYSYRWAGCNGSSSSRRAQDYHGASAGSEPETRALMDLAERIRPMASISYHSYSELVLYPYGCQGDVTGENELLAKVGKELAEMLPSDSGKGHYTPGTPWQLLYGVDGDSMGFMFANYGAIAYTFEVNEDFQPPYEIREPTLVKHRVAWQYFLDEIQKRLLTVEVRDAHGNPAQATLKIAQIPHTKGERDFGTNAAGNYFKVLLPGRYSIQARTKSGLSAEGVVDMTDRPTTLSLTVR